MSLINAMQAFVDHGGDRSKMDVLAWAKTYGVEPDAVRRAFESVISVVSQKPVNDFDCEGK